MYDDGEDSLSEDEELLVVSDRVTRIANEIIEDLLSEMISYSDDDDRTLSQEDLGFSDNFIDVYKFPDDFCAKDDSDVNGKEVEEKSSDELYHEGLEEFTDIFKSHDERFSSEDSELSSTESDSGRGRVYKVTEQETGSEEDLYYSSEDLMLKFVEAEEDTRQAGTEQSEDLISLEIQDKFQLQVEKHVLKFELSKQLFEGKGADMEDSPRLEDSSDVLKERKRKMNEELFANLFDYELQQVENIKLGQSRLSKTLAKANLLKLEKDICIKRRRPFCYEDIFTMRRSPNVLSRSQSQPNLDSITEEDLVSSSVPEPGTVRPILKKTGGILLNSSGSQTDITALSSVPPSRSSSVTFLLPSPDLK